MKKYYPYISIAIGFGIIALYMYSTRMHEQFMKDEGSRIVAERNIKRTNRYINELGSETKFDYWLGNKKDTLYRSYIDITGDLLLTEMSTNDSWRMLKTRSKDGNIYEYNSDFILRIQNQKALIERGEKDLLVLDLSVLGN